MKVYVYQGVFSDNAENDIAIFSEKQKCLDYIKSEVERLCEVYEEEIELEDVLKGLDSWHLETQEHEITFHFKEIEVI